MPELRSHRACPKSSSGVHSRTPRRPLEDSPLAAPILCTLCPAPCTLSSSHDGPTLRSGFFLLPLFVPACASPPRTGRTPVSSTAASRSMAHLHRYVVYLPDGWNRQQTWPVILFLHGSGERGSEGMDETQIGLPQAIRLHPERWPFVVVMPQVPFSHHHWTDPDMMAMAMAALDAEVKEFHGDRDRVYLTGLSLGGYGTWEIAKAYPHRFAALVPVCGGVFWSYQPDRWREVNTLPAEYARARGTHADVDLSRRRRSVVNPKQSLLHVRGVEGQWRRCSFLGVRRDQTQRVGPRVWRAAVAALAAGAAAERDAETLAAGRADPRAGASGSRRRSTRTSTTPTSATTRIRTKLLPRSTGRETACSIAIASAK